MQVRTSFGEAIWFGRFFCPLVRIWKHIYVSMIAGLGDRLEKAVLFTNKSMWLYDMLELEGIWF